MFDLIIKTAMEKFGLSDKAAGGLVAALLGMIADPKSGGFGGFIDKFKNAGLGDAVSSWIAKGDNTPLTNDQVTSALGSDAIKSIAESAGVDTGTATTALGGIIPSVVDTLTPDGVVPDQEGLLSKIGGFLSDWGVAIGGAVADGVGAAAAIASGAAEKAGEVAGAAVDKGKEVIAGGVDAVAGAAGAAKDTVAGAAGAAKDTVAGAVSSVTDAIDSGSSGILKWLIPLLLLGLLLLLGYWYCGRGGQPTAPANANANKAGANNATNANANANANQAVTNTQQSATERKLGEVVLPDGTKLQAYAGGIEDQLVKFIQSDEFKNATPEQLKDKWFNFDDLNFKFGSTELTPESKRQLENIQAILKAYPNIKIKIGAYTDKKGDDAANLKLSDDRAKSVQAALHKAGFKEQVPEAEGYGEKFATVDENASDDARKVDRKTAVRLIK